MKNGRRRRFPFPGIPSGWFVVAASAELPAGAVLTRRYFDRELVLYRTASGVVRMADAFCPHMGAHLGKTGTVDGERLRCGFHGFRYDTTGRCVATAYDGPPPPAARLRLWEVREQNGHVLAWFDAAGAAPSWEVPALEDHAWTPIRWRRYPIATTPQETTENSVDFGHFTQLHGFTTGEITRPLQADGPFLTNTYRGRLPFGVPLLPKVPLWLSYDVKVWGLGYSLVHVNIEALRLKLRLWVLPVPIDEEHIDLRLTTSVPRAFGPLAPLVRFFSHRIFCGEVEQDLDVWNHKAFVEKPALAKGDGPIAEYRRWAAQFYQG